MVPPLRELDHKRHGSAAAAIAVAALLAVVAGPFPIAAVAQTFDEVHRCDELAAHPGDPNRWAPGVDDDALVPGPAMKSCAEAVESWPFEARFHFQYGRALWAARRYDQAVAQFLRAQEMEYAPTYAYLGDAHLHGLGGVEEDRDFAATLYRMAAEAGFVAASSAPAGLGSTNPRPGIEDAEPDGSAQRPSAEPAVDLAAPQSGEPPSAAGTAAMGEEQPATAGSAQLFNPGRFSNSRVLKRLYDGEFEALDNDEIQAPLTVYLLGLNDYFSQPYNFNDPACSAVGDPGLASTVMRRATGRLLGGDVGQQGLNILQGITSMAQNPMGAINNAIELDLMKRSAATDGARLAMLYGCEGPVFKRLQANLVAYIEGYEPAAASGWPGIRLQCMRHAKSSGSADPRKYCGCIADKFKGAGISWEEADRFQANYDHAKNFALMLKRHEGLRRQIGSCLL